MSRSLEQIRIRLKKAIESGQITKEEIKKSAGFSGSQLNRYIEGESEPGIDAVDRIADALKVKPWDLIKPPEATNAEAEILTKLAHLSPKGRGIVLNLIDDLLAAQTLVASKKLER
jgi:transcriptional regulator with XRE-family HTH domain